jgi:hypothetical protein
MWYTLESIEWSRSIRRTHALYHKYAVHFDKCMNMFQNNTHCKSDIKIKFFSPLLCCHTTNMIIKDEACWKQGHTIGRGARRQRTMNCDMQTAGVIFISCHFNVLKLHYFSHTMQELTSEYYCFELNEDQNHVPFDMYILQSNRSQYWQGKIIIRAYKPRGKESRTLKR